MEISDYLVTQIREGRAILVLGAGASRDSIKNDGKKCPNAIELGERLSDRFLGGQYKSASLTQISEYAISESDLTTVQSFIRDQFVGLLPTEAHLQIPHFAWWGIATTNYDVLIEDAYEHANPALQFPRRMIDSTDRVEDNLRDPRNILLLKLHGCISRINNSNCPLILTTEQYLEHRKGRARLFDHFRNWGYEHSIVFVGQSLQDTDLRAVINELTTEVGGSRPRYYMVAPDVDAIRSKAWEAKKVELLKGTFSEFMSALESAVQPEFRTLATIVNPEQVHEIESRFRVHAVISRSTLQFLQNDAEYVNAINATEIVNPSDFYRGLTSGFSPVEQNLDVRRKLTDSILSDYFLRDIEEPEEATEILVVKAHAGAGKSVFVRRLAWDAARNFNRIVLFLKSEGLLSVPALRELIGACKERVFLFIDNAADRVREVQSLLKTIGDEGKLLTIVLSERVNEWNVQAQALNPSLTEEFDLPYLSMQEIEQLLALLEKHKALGTLEKYGPDERRQALTERAGRQLLVALHEATLGIPFEEILVDEFRHIVPLEAQHIYLTICVLNRLDVSVRAGVVSRIHGVPFSEFKTNFFLPLEKVVFTHFDSVTRDYSYRARHPRIAEIVFERILEHAEDRFDAYIKCLKALNLGYSSDWKAFWKMVRGRTLIELFPDRQMVKTIFDAAKEIVGDDAHLLHQMAIFEMNASDGSYAVASALLNRAYSAAAYDSTIRHTVAELKLRMVERSETALEKSKLLKEAADISRSLISSEREDSYGHHTLAKVGIRTLRDALAANATEEIISKLIKEAEQNLFEGSQRFPGDPYLLEAEAELAKVLNDDKRALEAMKKAFHANPRSSFIALRLADIEEKSNRVDAALKVLQHGLNANNADRGLHFAYAKLLMNTDNGSNEELIYHLHRSFNDGDSNFDAQLLYARQLFLSGDIDGSKKVFAKLSKASLPPRVRNRLLYPIEGQFRGRIAKIETTYAFIVRDGTADWVYVHSSNVPPTVWRNMVLGAPVEFSIGFSFRGPNARDLRIVGSEAPAQMELGNGVGR